MTGDLCHGKRRYTSREAAKRDLRTVQRYRHEGAGTLITYYCEGCGGYHNGHRTWS